MRSVVSPEVTHRPDIRMLPSWWPIAAITIGFPIWWALGLSAAAWPLVSMVLLMPRLITSGKSIRLPRGFGWWMLFIAWVMLSATQITAASRLFSFGYRFSVYFAATIVFVYVYNESEERLPTKRVIALLVGMWVAVAVGGNIGAVFPRLDFPSPVELVLPNSALKNGLVKAMVHPEFAQVSRLFGQEIGRPHALFPYTNGWGSTWGILFPVVMGWLGMREPTYRARFAVLGVLGISIYSVVVSLNRGLWISIVVALIYTTTRFVAQRRILPIVLAALAAGLLLAVLSLTSLGDLVGSRAADGHSDEGRSSLYEQSVEKAIERPILGWGTPQPRAEGGDGPSVGTHGHVWLVMVSQGLVGLILYLAWWTTIITQTIKRATVWEIWLHAALIVVAVQMFFYEHTPVQLPIAMMIAALLLRKSPPDSLSPSDPAKLVPTEHS